MNALPHGPVVGLVLAAGSARRFGADKRQARLPDGQTLLDAVLRTQRAVLGTVLVVTGPDDVFATEACARHGAVPVPCPDAARGMGRSLAAGIRAVQQLAVPPGAVLLSLADMPLVRVETLASLLARFQATGEAVMPVLGSRPGHPRVLPRGCWHALGRLEGDEGARHAVDWSRAQKVAVDDVGVLLDVDTPQDLASIGA